MQRVSGRIRWGLNPDRQWLRWGDFPLEKFGQEAAMKTTLDLETIDALTAVELPDRTVICDCGCPLIEVNILSGDTFNVGSFDSVQTAVAVCGNQLGGANYSLFDSNGNLIFNSDDFAAIGNGGIDQNTIDQTAWVECDTSNAVSF